MYKDALEPSKKRNKVFFVRRHHHHHLLVTLKSKTLTLLKMT